MGGSGSVQCKTDEADGYLDKRSGAMRRNTAYRKAEALAVVSRQRKRSGAMVRIAAVGRADAVLPYDLSGGPENLCALLAMLGETFSGLHE